MGTIGVMEILAGLQNFDLTVLVASDEAAGGPQVTLFADTVAGTARAVEVRGTSAAKSSTNPGYQTTMRCVNLPLLQGNVGALDEFPVRFRSTGVAMTRATS